MQFHEKLKHLRTERGLTQQELAEKLNVSRSAVAKWENGLGLPSEESLDDIAAFFGVSRTYLISDRATEDVIVSKNGLLSAQKRWLIIFISIAAALLVAALALSGSLLSRRTHIHLFKVIVTWDPTCDASGRIEYACDCGETLIEMTEPLGHDWGEWIERTPSTCTTGGSKIRYCLRDERHRETKTEGAYGHDWGEWETVIPVGCEDDGILVRVCKDNSEHMETKHLSAIGHRWSDWELGAPSTCAELGYEAKHCIREGCTEVATRDLGLLEHKFGEWEVVRAATCLVPGEEGQVCAECSYREMQVIPITEHIFTHDICEICGRRDRAIADITDPDLYNGEFAFRALGQLDGGFRMQMLYYMIDLDVLKYHNGAENSANIGSYDYTAYNLERDDVDTVWKAYIDDHPLFYWLDPSVWTAYGTTVFMVRAQEEFADPAVRSALDQAIYEKAVVWRKGAEDNAYLAALYYHDLIVGEVDVAYLPSGYLSNTPRTNSIIGVFEGTGAISAGYARAFQLLLNMCGISNVVVTGTKGSTTAHTWNLVQLDDGEWYWYDLTSNDVPDWMWGVQYNYFALNDEQNAARADKSTASSKSFQDTHTVSSQNEYRYLSAIPARAPSPYASVNGELLLHETFTVGEFTYAVAGYRVVQLVRCTASGNVSVPESVLYAGVEYEVVSVGSMDESGYFASSSPCVFEDEIITLTFPATIRFLWDSGIRSYYRYANQRISAYAVSTKNEHFTAVDGVLFTKSMYTLVAYPKGASRASYEIPDEVVCISRNAFESTNALSSLKIGKNVRDVGCINSGKGWPSDETADSSSFISGTWCWIFRTLRDLETIEVDPENAYYSAQNGILLDKTGKYLYSAIASITELYIPASVEEIEISAFYSHYELTSVVFLGNALRKMGIAAFDNCTYLKLIVFAGTREQWDAVEDIDRIGSGIGRSTPDGTYTLVCLGDD